MRGWEGARVLHSGRQEFISLSLAFDPGTHLLSIRELPVSSQLNGMMCIPAWRED